MPEGAMAVRPRNTAHQMVASARTLRGPKRSARRPVGAWNRAYPSVKTLKTQPSWIWLRWNSCSMELAGNGNVDAIQVPDGAEHK